MQVELVSLAHLRPHRLRLLGSMSLNGDGSGWQYRRLSLS